MKTETVKCPKCDGTGFIGHYAHIANGVCFTCQGSGTITRKINAPSKMNATHCRTVPEAQAHRLAVFAEMFPGIELTTEDETAMKNGGNLKKILANYR